MTIFQTRRNLFALEELIEEKIYRVSLTPSNYLIRVSGIESLLLM